MDLTEKIRFFRSLKGWTQENIAEKLEISTCAYARIERGETDVNLSRLQQISNILETDLASLFSLDKKNIFNLTKNRSNEIVNINSSMNTQNLTNTEYKKCQHELEKANLIIDYQKQQIIDLRELVSVLKKID